MKKITEREKRAKYSTLPGMFPRNVSETTPERTQENIFRIPFGNNSKNFFGEILRVSA